MDKWIAFMFFMSICALAIVAIQPQQIKMVLDDVQDKQDKFIEKWDARVNTSNKINNQTQQKIVDTGNKILGNVTQEFGNLTQHRKVTNATFDKMEILIKAFNQTNEEKRIEAVNEIIKPIKEGNILLRQINSTLSNISSLHGK